MDMMSMLMRPIVRFFVAKAAHAMRSPEEQLRHTFRDGRYQLAFFDLICSVAAARPSSAPPESALFLDVINQLAADGVPEQEAITNTRLLLTTLDRADRSEHLVSLGVALDQSGQWEEAIRVYEIAAQMDESISTYARNCIDDIRRKATIAD